MKEYLRRENIEKAKASFGKWEERDNPSKEIVKELRKDGKRRYAEGESN